MSTGLGPRAERERRTVAKMIGVYCRGRHGGDGSLCADCQGLLDFATFRLQRCPHGEAKPTCAKCPIHCYKPDRRAQIRDVMRYAGPRMLLRHPWFTLRHWIDGFKDAPPRERRA
ncbi:MAG: nitrous oxide-stimulated promoter family protein [Planctomycetes bacterium]|nr:nitrous oxide-stimulated promoter family protein [Planctomycetota bacterium]